jgi:hypothetical protein
VWRMYAGGKGRRRKGDPTIPTQNSIDKNKVASLYNISSIYHSPKHISPPTI